MQQKNIQHNKRSYLIAWVKDAGQFGGLLESLGAGACKALMVLDAAAICARVLVEL